MKGDVFLTVILVPCVAILKLVTDTKTDVWITIIWGFTLALHSLIRGNAWGKVHLLVILDVIPLYWMWYLHVPTVELWLCYWYTECCCTSTSIGTVLVPPLVSCCTSNFIELKESLRKMLSTSVLNQPQLRLLYVNQLESLCNSVNLIWPKTSEIGWLSGGLVSADLSLCGFNLHSV